MKTLLVILTCVASLLPSVMMEAKTEIYPGGVTRTVTVSIGGEDVERIQCGDCCLFKDPDPNTMTKNWRCIDKQLGIYHDAKQRNDYAVMVLFAPWSSQEAWSWYRWAHYLAVEKTVGPDKRSDLWSADDYCDKAMRACRRAIRANIGVGEARRCRDLVKVLQLDIKKRLSRSSTFIRPAK